jgi:hypothetical protein
MCRVVAAVLTLVLAAVHAQDRPSNQEWKEAQAGAAADAAAVKAKDSKMAAVQKVIDLLFSLKAQVLSEGESEAKTYNEFACFCKDSTNEKTTAIKKGEDRKTQLAGFIEQEATIRDGHDSAIATLTEEIAASEKTQKTASDKRSSDNKLYSSNAKDLTGALEALEGAIASLKSSKSPSLEQLRSVKSTVHTAVLLADALGLANELSTKGIVDSFLQADPEVAMENYKFHSDGIIATLEKLHTDFKNEKADVDAAEVESVKLHDKFMQEQTDLVKRKQGELADNKKGKAEKHASIAEANEQRSTVSAVLLDDQEYLKELSEICSEKAVTWDQRSGVRQDELSALTAAIAVVQEAVAANTTAATIRFAQQGASVRLAERLARNPAYMEAVEADAEAADAATPVAFFQRQAKAAFLAPVGARAGRKAPQMDDGRHAVAELLRTNGQKLKSALLTSLAGQVAEDPLGNFNILIK